MKKIVALIIGCVLVAGCSADDVDPQECSDLPEGLYTYRFTQVSGNCGEIPSQDQILSSNMSVSNMCKTTASYHSPDYCEFGITQTCSDADGSYCYITTQAQVGVRSYQGGADVVCHDKQANQTCSSRYNFTVTKTTIRK